LYVRSFLPTRLFFCAPKNMIEVHPVSSNTLLNYLSKFRSKTLCSPRQPQLPRDNCFNYRPVLESFSCASRLAYAEAAESFPAQLSEKQSLPPLQPLTTISRAGTDQMPARRLCGRSFAPPVQPPCRHPPSRDQLSALRTDMTLLVLFLPFPLRSFSTRT